MELVDVLRDHGVEQVAPLELGQCPVGVVRLLFTEHLESGPVETPELGGVAAEGVDVRHIHWVHLLPQPLPRTPEVRNPTRHRDPRSRQSDSALGMPDQLSELYRSLCRYLPCHFGDLFPRNAEMPSLASSDTNAAAKPCFSASIPSSRSAL